MDLITSPSDVLVRSGFTLQRFKCLGARVVAIQTFRSYYPCVLFNRHEILNYLFQVNIFILQFSLRDARSRGEAALSE